MVAQTAGFRTRAQLRLRPPRRFSRNITPARGGCVVHWGGPRQSNGSHAQCEATWRAWQNMHMGPGGLGTRNGANDIAYTAAFCNHGFVLAGRGWNVRTGANGSNVGNQSYYAFAWIGGAGQTANRRALDALEWLILEARGPGSAADRVVDHATFQSTTCCGPQLRGVARTLDRRVIRRPGDGGAEGERIMRLTVPMMRGGDVEDFQRDLNRWRRTAGRAPIAEDGWFGSETAGAASEFMAAVMGVTTDDPRVGDRTLAALAEAIRPREPWRGKQVRAVRETRFYLRPGWFPANPEAGRLPEGWRFAGGVHEQRDVGSGSQYRVSNSNGDMRWITAHEDFVELVDPR